MPPPPAPTPLDRGVSLFRVYAALAFSYAWIPVMFTAFTIDRGFTPSQYARFWSVYYLAMVVAEIPWGRLADRIGERPLLVAGPLWLAACFAVLGHASSADVVLLAMAATGAGHAMISGADSAYLYELVAARGTAADALREETVAHRWRLLGVSGADLGGGLAAAAWGTAASFDLSIGLMLAAAAVAWRLPASPRILAAGRPTWRGFGRALGQPGVAWVLAWYAVVFVMLRIGFQLYQPTLLALGERHLAVHGAVLSLLNLSAGCSAWLVLPVFRRLEERGTATLVLLLLLASFGGLALLSGAATPAGVLALGGGLFVLQQVSFGFLQPIGRTALNQRVATGDRASMLSAQSVLARLAFGLVLAVGDWDAALTTRLDATYAALAAAAGAASLIVFATHRRRRLNHPHGTGML